MSASNIEVKFIEYHQPPLDSGSYKITVKQTIKSNKSSKIPLQEFSNTLNFVVSGHRFAPLTSDDIYAIFPPSGNLGEYSNALPHITLKRSTLPWERSINVKEPTLPWLALLLFRESEKPTPKTIQLKDIQASPAKFPQFISDPGEIPEDELTVIDVPKKLLAQILPTQKDVALLAHINQLTNTDPNIGSLSEPLATILGNRLPQAGEVSTVHLVCLENRYPDGQFDYQGAKDDDLIRLVSLKSWSFACVNQRHNFTALLEKLDREPGTVRLPSRNNNQADNYLNLGYIPLAHALRQGDKTISWYHSPLSPGKNPDQLSGPVVMADALVRYDSNSGLFDVSYAAAWQLGRMLTLHNKTVAVELFNWKRSNAQNLHQIQQQVLYLPFQGEASNGTTNMPPEAIATWFRDLELLRHIPFNYLLPDEKLLPPESLRFFWVDSYWVDCLQDGAFSIGRVTAEDLKTDTQIQFKASVPRPDELITGFLLHSEAVSGWPGLEVEGYSDLRDNLSVADSSKKLTILRKEQLSDSVLLCLFKGEVKTIDFSLKPESVNCGVDPINQGQIITKGLRKLDGEQVDGEQGEQGKKEINVPFKNKELGVIDVENLADSIKKKLNYQENFTSAQFALTMIEGAQKIRFCQKA
ncbi:hypothetical protein G7B40_031800 [Aetokthonos hydrillicola Thurmond2011]|uniref:Uncharacterized protein n=1 Tax=Aetokthonos hydrillicola Thurmond2011 TaxID=2712845 RepID=A0AAP5IFC1_9CYAN|nr:hypothetical protein [Aetokthonos hydrillicola]MBO3461278.1 hypothetical protein [Aetokthonos hydrillicola CCALA 1050]MBW4589617.1 hypothetical protein [Aetokthonos hydrillicola CCALA 1050]MDR9899112.1 hypothetical protein [Aetokthonos hydrillicola Thurmond2011]